MTGVQTCALPIFQVSVPGAKAPLQALIFDSVFNSFRGIIAYFKIENGEIRKGDKVKFFNTGMEYVADEVGEPLVALGVSGVATEDVAPGVVVGASVEPGAVVSGTVVSGAVVGSVVSGAVVGTV